MKTKMKFMMWLMGWRRESLAGFQSDHGPMPVPAIMGRLHVSQMTARGITAKRYEKSNKSDVSSILSIR
jgi:hypothetical protein